MKYLKTILVSLIFIFPLTIVILFLVLAKNLNYPVKPFLDTVISAGRNSDNLPSHINFLILGLDKRDDWLETNQDTDTIIFANLNTDNLSTKLISLPRDIWYQKTSTRINKIYQLSFQQPNPTDYIKTSFQDIIGQSIDHIVVIDTQVMLPIIQAIGPVELYLDYDLVDDQYPDPRHIENPQAHLNPYMTISFDKGQNIIDAGNVIYFVRSRKGTDMTESGGTDTGRSQRQQLLISAIIDKIKKDKIYLKPKTALSLYHIWSQQITKDVDDQTLLAILFKHKFNISALNIKSIYLPVGQNAKDDQATIYHPTNFINGAWIYLSTKPEYSSIHHFVDQQIN